MPNQEAIRQELERTVAAAAAGEETHRQYLLAKLTHNRTFTDVDLINHVTTQVEAEIARWAKAGLDYPGNTPAEALAFVHREATDAIFKGVKQDTDIGRAMHEHRKNTFMRFIRLTEPMLDEGE